jgi:hypothetical protein
MGPAAEKFCDTLSTPAWRVEIFFSPAPNDAATGEKLPFQNSDEGPMKNFRSLAMPNRLTGQLAPLQSAPACDQ